MGIRRRGGLDRAIFAWGNDMRLHDELMANFWQGDFPWRNSGDKGWRGTTPVGLFAPNGYGLSDVTGNVSEWTSDYYSAAAWSKAARTSAPPSYCLRYRPAARQLEAIDTSTSHIGFRCIRR